MDIFKQATLESERNSFAVNYEPPIPEPIVEAELVFKEDLELSDSSVYTG